MTGVDSLVVVVDRDRQDLLGALLADYVLVERRVDLARVGQLGRLRLGARRLEHLLLDDLLAEVDALVADIDALAGDELAHLLLALAAERAAVRNLGPLAPAGAGHARYLPVPFKPSAGDPRRGRALRVSRPGLRHPARHAPWPR